MLILCLGISSHRNISSMKVDTLTLLSFPYYLNPEQWQAMVSNEEILVKHEMHVGPESLSGC